MTKKRIRLLIFSAISLFVCQLLFTNEASAATRVVIRLTQKNITMDKGQTKRIKAIVKAGKKVSKKVSYRSGDRKVAVVDSTGKITAKGAGTTVIKVVSKADKKAVAQCVVKVVLNDTKKLKNKVIRFPVNDEVKSRVIKTYEEFQNCMEDLKEIDDDWYDNAYNRLKKEIKLSRYNEEYFKDKVLYFQQFLSCDCREIHLKKIERVIKPNRKYIMRIIMTDDETSKNYDYPTVQYRNLVLVEASKSYAKRIDKVKFDFVFHK